jgi:hypothetical protein
MRMLDTVTPAYPALLLEESSNSLAKGALAAIHENFVA